MSEKNIGNLGTDLETLLKLQAAFLTTHGNGWREYNCAYILNKQVLEIMGVLTKELGKEQATRFFNGKFGIAESLIKDNPKLLAKINRQGRDSIEKIKDGTITFEELREINRII